MKNYKKNKLTCEHLFKFFLICLMLFNTSCSKQRNKIAFYVYYNTNEIEYDTILWTRTKIVSQDIGIYYLENTKILNNFFNIYDFIYHIDIMKDKYKKSVPKKISSKFGKKSDLSKAIASVKQENIRLLILLKPKEINSSKVYNVHFSVIDLADDFKIYKISTVYKIDRNTNKDIFRAENKKSVKVILNELTEIIKKTEK